MKVLNQERESVLETIMRDNVLEALEKENMCLRAFERKRERGVY